MNAANASRVPPASMLETRTAYKLQVGTIVRAVESMCIADSTTKKTELANYNPKPTPAWFGGAMRRRQAITKKTYLFVRFFHVQTKHQNGAVFFNIRRLRPCWSKVSYGTLALTNGPPSTIESALIAPEIAIVGKPGLWGHFGHFAGQNMPFWPATSEPGLASPKKSPNLVLA